MTIEQIAPELTWRLRRDELYPNEYLFNMELEEDKTGMHFGGFQNNQLIAVVSLFKNADDFQFRKLAVSHLEQGKSYGSQLLNFVTDFATAEGGTRLWCNARDTATGFYLKNGFVATHEKFERKGINYVIMEKTL